MGGIFFLKYDFAPAYSLGFGADARRSAAQVRQYGSACFEIPCAHNGSASCHCHIDLWLGASGRVGWFGSRQSLCHQAVQD